MSAKISAARRAAFLKFVAETGNQTLAAERAKVSLSWVTKHRARDSGFDAAVRDARREAQDRLLAAEEQEGRRTPDQVRGDGKGYHQGHELIIRGTRSGRAGQNKRLVQIGRARVRQWTASSERRFLEVLSETANVKAACAAVGLSPASAYNHRDRRPDFERRWRETLNIVHLRLEFALVEQAASLVEPGGVPCDGPIREMTASEALYLLEMHKRREAGAHNRAGRQRWTQPPIEEVLERVRRSAAAIRAARVPRDEGEPGAAG